jgi:predicted RNase H-like nuclease (RuvC/YqgF family)
MSNINESAEKLSNSLNNMYETNTKDLVSLVKKQSEEINRRGHIVMKMDESIKLQQQNIQRLQEQNKHLESMVEDLRIERQKLLEEIKDLKLKNKKTVSARTRKTKAKEKVGDEPTTDAA